MKKYKVLISAPFYKHQHPLLDNWKKYIQAERDYSKHEVLGFLVVNNTPDQKIADKAMKLSEPKFIEVVNIGIGTRDEKLLESRNLAIKKAIDEKYDFLYFYDVDVMSQEAILNDLIKYGLKENVACVSGKVPMRGYVKEPTYTQPGLNLLQYKDIKLLNKPPIPNQPPTILTQGKKYISGRLEPSNYKGQKQAKDKDIPYVEMNALGFGCCVIKREALMRFPQIPPVEKWSLGSEDFTYTNMMFKIRYKLLLIKDIGLFHAQINHKTGEIRWL